MKVLQIIAAYKPAYIYGGPTMSVAELSEQLMAADVHTEVFATTANGSEELPYPAGKPVVMDGVKVTYFKRMTKDHSHFSPALLLKLWQEARQFDVIHIHAWWNLVSILSCGIALARKIPVVISPRGTLSSYSLTAKRSRTKHWFQQVLGVALLNRCHLHVTSALEEQQIRTLLKPRSIHLIPNFVKVNSRPASHPPQETVFRLLFLSRIHPKKGLNLLIDALPALKFPFHLTIAGSGDEAYIHSLRALAEANKVAACIEWAGFRQQDKFSLLAAHDLLVLPSYDENFGNVVIESLSEGTAVLVSSSVGLARYVTENNLGWQCGLMVKEIADILNQIAQKRADLLRIRNTAPGLIRSHFNAPSLVQKYVAMYQQLL